MQVHSVVFALSRQINKQKYAKTINLVYLLCAGNKVFVIYQAQGEVLTPTPCVRPWSEKPPFWVNVIYGVPLNLKRNCSFIS